MYICFDDGHHYYCYLAFLFKARRLGVMRRDAVTWGGLAFLEQCLDDWKEKLYEDLHEPI